MEIIRLPESGIPVEIDAMLDRGRTHFAEEFERLTTRAKKAGVDLETEIEVGHPAEHILSYAEDNHAHMIVMARRGLNRATRFILGSVSEPRRSKR